MIKVLILVTMAVLAISASANPEAKPGVLAPIAYSAPLVAAPLVTATSSQSFVRNYNGIAAAPLVAAAAPIAYTAAGTYAPYSPYAAYVSPATYAAYNPYVAPAAALKYTAAPVFL